MRTVFNSYKSFKGGGSQLVYRFIKEFQESFCQRVFKYARHRLQDLDTGGFEHAFYYGEEVTKTFVTGALDDVCKSNVMQEYSVERKKTASKNKRSTANGKLDYWCGYGDLTKISILMEVKQHWIQYRSPNHPKPWTVSKGGIKRHHDKANEQIRDIKDKTLLAVGSLYGLALTILPIYVRYKSKEEDPVYLNTKLLNAIAGEARREANANAYGAFCLKKELCLKDFWDTDNGTVYQSYPGVVLLWSINKLTRG